ncbi:MAG: amidohydrolase family protein [Chitinophaga sp.]|uniref:amidohydrolase family protein n=1 Tax=Chitinophaga sp. TaxID=1869181 RepID=UPI001B23ECEC|nr:amidohydrolase family protein [Chitinophaga sp.]MBO9731423.1 amidohydrolase family protein [Chitinophaga sp.]
MKKLLLALLLLPLTFYAQTPNAGRLALTGATIYTAPGTTPITNGVVIIENGKITAVGTGQQTKIPAATPVLDCKGMVLMAGFWNCHVHFMEPKWNHADSLPVEQLNRQLNDMVNSRGFTHVFDLGTLDFPNLLALKARINKGEVNGPAMLTVGVPFVPPNGNPFYIEPLKLPEMSTLAAAKAHVTEQIKTGADGIKVWSASPHAHKTVPMPLDILKAACVTAHQFHKPVFAHPTADTGVIMAMEGGVNILTHPSPDGYRPWDAAEIKLLQQHQIALIPTLKLFKYELERNKLVAATHPLMTTALQQVGAYAKAGGEILFGTDVGYVPDYSTEDEFRLLSEAGLSFDQVLTALTTAPARRFGQAQHSGRIAKGMDADLVVLKADPHTDIRHFSEVVYTIRNGKMMYDSRTMGEH